MRNEAVMPEWTWPHARRGAAAPVPATLAWAGLVWALGAAVFFRYWWWSGLDLVMGDRGDGRFIAYLLEHWRLALGGAHSWTSPPMHHPLEGGLGRSDALVLFLPVYLPLRAVGADMWAAFQWTLVATTLVGFGSAVVLVHRIWRLPLWAALAGAVLFAFPNNLHIQAGHGQMFAVQFIAPLLVAASLAVAWRATRPLAAALAAGGLGAGEALLLFTSYYTGWFLALAGLVFALAYALLDRARLRLDPAAPWLRLGLAAAAGFAVAIIPFLIVYLPQARAGDAFSYQGMLSLMGSVRDIWNVGPANLVWGPLLERLGTAVTPHLLSGEHPLLVTPLVGLFCIVGTIQAWRRAAPRRDPSHAILMAAMCAGIFLLVATLQVKGASVWPWIRDIVPGASALRAIMRGHLVTSTIAALAVPVLLVWLHDFAARHVPPRRALAGVLALAALFAVEQVNTHRNAHVSRSAELAWMERVAPPPPGCAAFFATAPDPEHPPFYEVQIDAMLVALKTGVPTLNGYTGLWPRHWTMVHPGRDDYLAQVADWIARNGLGENLCVLDTGTWSWEEYRPA